jgi:hypothetical protein
LSNFTQCTIRVPAATACVAGFSGSHESFATASSHVSLESLPYFIPSKIPSNSHDRQTYMPLAFALSEKSKSLFVNFCADFTSENSETASLVRESKR